MAATDDAQPDRGEDSLLDRLPGGRVVAKDLTTARSALQGNAFCRFNTTTKERKYCSRSLWEDAPADKKYVIPENGSIPRLLVECQCCGRDSYRTDDDACGTCGKPIFDCPACDEEVHGMPDECPHCDAAYNWNN